MNTSEDRYFVSWRELKAERDGLAAKRDALENALREIAEPGGTRHADVRIARAALAATDTTRDGEVCACLDETGERKVRLYERCERCGTFMPAGERQET